MFSVVSYELLYGKTGGGHAEYEYTEAGTYTINIPENVVADIAIVGGGGWALSRIVPGAPSYFVLGGGGSAFVGRIKIPAKEYTVIVGDVQSTYETSINTNSSFSDLIVAHGGKVDPSLGPSSAKGGVLSLSDELQVVSTQISSDGNDGYVTAGLREQLVPPTLPYTGGASLYKGYGMGARYGNGETVFSATPGTGGYFYLKY